MLIVEQNPDKSIVIISPSDQALEQHGLVAIAMKDVFNGNPFWIVEEKDIPKDRTFRDAWEIPEEWGDPDGYGSPRHAFEEEINAKN